MVSLTEIANHFAAAGLSLGNNLEVELRPPTDPREVVINLGSVVSDAYEQASQLIIILYANQEMLGINIHGWEDEYKVTYAGYQE